MSDLLPEKFLAIDEEGYALNGDMRVTDDDLGLQLLAKLKRAPNGAYVSKFGQVPVVIEAFDEPLVARHAEKLGPTWSLDFPYGHTETFDPATLRVDEWDRFHGLTKRGLPFVFSRSGQADFFNLLEEYDDESITLGGKTYEVPPLYQGVEALNSSSGWDQFYQESKTPWNIGEAAPALMDMLSRLKIIKSRILVLGCGEGHDAAFFAKVGHVVTAVDFSDEALERAKKNYGDILNITWEKADVFKMDRGFDGAFDIVFDHTLYCAVDPARRNELVKNWTRWIAENGHLMGIFFTNTTASGPPFGGTEWELRQRLQKRFRFIFWGRWQKSLPDRQGKELFVYAQKLEEKR